VLSSRCRAILCAKLRQLANTPPVPQPIPPIQIQNNLVWNSDNAASVGANNPGAPGTHAVCDLFNNAQDGSSLYIYALMTFNLGTESIRVQQVQGHTPGTSQGPSYSVNAGGGQPPGILYIDQIAGSTQPNTDPYIFGTLSNQDEYIIPAGPIMILPPGYSMRLLNNAVQFGFQCWIYYLSQRYSR
jgi:hypothetical protein